MAPGALTIFEQAIALPAGERPRFLDSVCADASLRAEVERMLQHDAAIGASEASPAAAFAPTVGAAAALPEWIGGYRILGRLGEGASGVVLLAEQPQPRRRVALKLLQSGSLSSAGLRRFAIEAEALARLRHPGIVHIYEAGVAEVAGAMLPYLATELVEGVPLSVWRQQAQPSWRVCVQVAIQILAAVDYTHRQGVIHRDLKPLNLVIRGDSEAGSDLGGVGAPRVCILDFGVARVLQQTAGGERTLQGTIVGTLAYMSPEQAAGEPDVDTRTDIYSVGAICYELLAGTPPIAVGGPDFAADCARVRTVAPVLLGRLDARFRGDLEAVLAKALAKDPNGRYGSAGAFADDLRAVLAAEPVQARRPTAWQQFALFARRRRGLVTTLGAVTAAGLAALVVVVLSYASVSGSEQRVVRVLTMVTRRVFELEHSLGTLALRTELLTGMQPELDDLLARDPNRFEYLELRADLAVARGNLELQSGRADEAARYRQEALQRRERLVERRPADLDLQARLAADIIRLGDLDKRGHDPRPARRRWSEAQAILERVAAARPDNPSSLDDLAHGCNRLAHAAIETGELDAAQVLLDRQEALGQSLARLAPERVANLAAERSLWLMRAHLCGARGDRAGKLQCSDRVMEVCAGWLDRRPNDIEALIGYLSTLETLAEGLWADGDHAAGRNLVAGAKGRIDACGLNPDDERVRDLVGILRQERWRAGG